MRKSRLASLAAGSLALAVTGLGAAASPATADPLPADYSGSTHGDMVSMSVSAGSELLEIEELAGVTIGHSATTTDSTADPATTAESANLEAALVDQDIEVDRVGVVAPPSDSYDRELADVDIPGLLAADLLDASGEANFVSTTECVPDGTPLTSALTRLASVDLGIGEELLPSELADLLDLLTGGLAEEISGALTSIASVGVVETTGTTYLDGTDVVSEQTVSLAAIELLGGLATVTVDSPVVLTATSDGTSGTVAYSNPTATVDFADDTIADVTLNGGDTETTSLSIDTPLVGSLGLDLTLALAPDPSTTTTGPTASATVTNLLSIDVGITATDRLAGVLGADVADVSLGVSPMSVSATAPEGGVECGAPEPTEEPSEEPTADATEGPSEEPTAQPTEESTDTGGPATPSGDPTPVAASGPGPNGPGPDDPAEDTVLPAAGSPAGLGAMLLLGLGALGLGGWLLRRRTTLA